MNGQPPVQKPHDIFLQRLDRFIQYDYNKGYYPGMRRPVPAARVGERRDRLCALGASTGSYGGAAFFMRPVSGQEPAATAPGAAKSHKTSGTQPP